jgi:hypothetical protein
MNARYIRSLALLVVAALIVGPSAALAQKKSRDVITREEILKSAQKDGDLYTAIKMMRPHMLDTPRGVRSLGGSGTNIIAIYIDKIRQPGPDVLLQMPANTVAEVRYLDPSRSQNEFGITANGGAIIVKRYVAVSLADSLAGKKTPQ